jgi:transcriptional regulator GlxA family with amidase domain
MTTAGGTSSIDLMLKIIADDHGEELANAGGRPADLFLDPHRPGHPAAVVPTRIGVRHPKLSQVIQMMEANIEEPISPRSWPRRWACRPASWNGCSGAT